MKKTLILLTVMLMVLTVGVTTVNAKFLTFYKGSFLGDTKDVTVIHNATFATDQLQVKIAKAQGKYVIALTVVDSKVTTFYGDKVVRNIFNGPTTKTLMNEVDQKNLAAYRIFFYKQKGFLYRKPIAGFSFGELTNVKEYATIQEAREAIQ